jgi:hypothetical protein
MRYLPSIEDVRVDGTQRGRIIHEDFIPRHAKDRASRHGNNRDYEVDKIVVCPDYFDKLLNDFCLPAGRREEDRDRIPLALAPRQFLNNLPEPLKDVHADFAAEVHHIRVEPILKIGLSIADHFEDDVVVGSHGDPTIKQLHSPVSYSLWFVKALVGNLALT